MLTTARTIAVAFWSLPMLVMKLRSIFTSIELKFLQVAETGISSPKVVHCQFDAKLLEAQQCCEGLLGILQQHTFGDFQLETTWRDATVIQCGTHCLIQTRVLELHR